MRSWYFPSWRGDFRLEADGEASVLKVLDPSPLERERLDAFLGKASKKKWSEVEKLPEKLDADHSRDAGWCSFAIAAPVAEAGEVLSTILKPAAASITAVRFSDGKVEVTEAHAASALVAKAKDDKESKGASTSRPTPSCPQCFAGSIEPAREVLLSFLDEEQHRDWAQSRAIVVMGGLTGHRYLLAHRQSKIAARIGRVCFDLDDRCVMHFHDITVPPEEEVLAAKLILEHRENWLRNEATCFTGTERFKNPFGGYADGTESAGLLEALGSMPPELIALVREQVRVRPDAFLDALDTMARAIDAPGGIDALRQLGAAFSVQMQGTQLVGTIMGAGPAYGGPAYLAA